MEKALEKINQMINTCEALSSHGALYKDLKIVKAYIEEAMKPKTCDGCKFFLVKNLGRTGYCNYMNDCCRFEKPDLYEPKDNA